MQSLVEDGEDDRLGEADDEQRNTGREHDLAKRQRRNDVSCAGQQFGDEVVLVALEARLRVLIISSAAITETKLAESRTATAPPPTEA